MLNQLCRNVLRIYRGPNPLIPLTYSRTKFCRNYSSAVKAKKWVMAEKFSEFPKVSDIQLVEEELPPLTEGQILVEALFASVDPYMRPYMVMHGYPKGTTMIGQQVVKVVESKSEDYPVDTHVLAHCGWRSHTILSKDGAMTDVNNYYKLPECITEAGFSPSLGLGVLGMPGLTAYFGLLDICNPQPGEVVLVNTGAGAVGSAVGQLAKIRGCKVIGYAGSAAKCEYMKNLGFDHVFNYKSVDIETSLREAAPEGVDCFFDNVGGQFLDTVLNKYMKTFGRVSLCGASSQYNKRVSELDQVRLPNFRMIAKSLSIQGFVTWRYQDRVPEAVEQLTQWIKEGKLKYREHITEGFENLPQAFFGLLRGENIGKAVVRC